MEETLNIKQSLATALKLASTGDLSSIPDLLSQLTLDLDEVESDLQVKGKTLEQANREQPELYYKYQVIHQRLKSIVKMIDSKIEHQKSLKYKSIKTGANIALNTTDLNQWVNSDKDIHAMCTVELLVIDYLQQYEAIVKAFEARGYSLKNVTESRIHMINGMTIT